MLRSLVGSEMCIRDRYQRRVRGLLRANMLSRYVTSAAARSLTAAHSARHMSKTVGIVTEKPFAPAAVDGIEQVFKEAGYQVSKFEKYESVEELKQAVQGIDAAIVRSDKISAEVMDASDSLKLVVRAGAGVDTIDLNAATERDIVVMNTPGQNANAVAELAFGMMLTNARNHYDGTSGYELRGKTLALYGYGAVAQQMHKLAKGFEMEVWAFDPFVSGEAMEKAGVKAITEVPELFDANFVSLHCPLTDDTRSSIGKDLLSRMPQKGAVINTARKEVIDEAGLEAAFADRSDLRYLSDVKPDNVDGMGGNLFATAKKMGAQTAEANINAGLAAAKQIVGFFEEGDKKFQVNKPGQTF
eukprot:TRINITY_DN28086_c0_g1_i8.p1 TRINITY_DN28086_c0_g1~~TRINITY_DN28086_c0_g1_i8.p1  ORF type:complete len:375 (+),score=134.59 TRINITY_DN28086_c0_g1_i8:53-1126(+)